MGYPNGYQIPQGHVPGREFVASGDPFGIKLGTITRIDELHMKCDVKVLTGGGVQREVDLTQPMHGPRSFLGGVPEVGSLVILGYRRKHKNLYEAMILGYMPNVGLRSGLRFDPMSSINPGDVTPDDQAQYDDLLGTTVRYKRLKLNPGDVGGMSASGAEMALSKDVRLSNRAGDLIELRDSDRTLVSQAVHRVEAEAGVHRRSGPIRRGMLWLPPDIMTGGANGNTLLSEADRYFGRDELQAAGPGLPGSPFKFSNAQGQLLDIFNDSNEFPPVTYSNGRRVFYAATQPAVCFEDPNEAGTEVYTEQRVEMYHTTDTSVDVLDEIDGFTVAPRSIYIEQVLGTLVGNDAYSGEGQRQYGRLLKPKIFDSFAQRTPGVFSLQEVPRNPMEQDIEAETTAGAYLFKIRPPKGVNGDFPFGVSVSKQGKLYVQLPGSIVENYADGATKNVSMEFNSEGAIKAHVGASSPDRVSLDLTLEGGIVADLGSSAGGQAIKVRYHSSVSQEYLGVPDENDVAYSVAVTGNMETVCSADAVENVLGAKVTTVNGGYAMLADRVQVQAQSGYTVNAGECNVLVSGKSQYNYALAVLENIVLGGKLSTIVAGGLIQNVVAGACSTNVLGGATALNSAAGAYTVNVGAGGMTMSVAAGAVAISAAAGAMSLAAGAGAIAVTAGLALNLTAGAALSMIAPQVLVGGPAGVLGVVRGVPALPPGTPSLDPITGTPLLGSATFRSI